MWSNIVWRAGNRGILPMVWEFNQHGGNVSIIQEFRGEENNLAV